METTLISPTVYERFEKLKKNEYINLSTADKKEYSTLKATIMDNDPEYFGQQKKQPRPSEDIFSIVATLATAIKILAPYMRIHHANAGVGEYEFRMAIKSITELDKKYNKWQTTF